MSSTQKRRLSLEAIEERINQLPLLPTVLSELMQLDQESDQFFEKLTELAKNDPPLATRVLGIANSASAAPSRPVVSIEEALIRVGANRVLALITAATVARVFTPSKPEHKAIWRHSIEVAYLSHFVARHFGNLEVDKDLAYSCGLLHDIGRFVLFEMASKALEATEARGWDSPVEQPKVEQKLLGFTHAEVGYIAAGKWELPKMIENVIRYHHRYDLWRSHKNIEEIRNLLTVVQFADFLSVFLEKNPDWSEWADERLMIEIKHHCVHKDWPVMDFPFDQLVANLPTINQECRQMLESLGVG